MSHPQVESKENQEGYMTSSAGNICFPFLQASLFATILEDVITDMRILVECNNELRITKTILDMGILLAKKFGITKAAVIDELEGIDFERLECDEYKLNKLDSDKILVLDVLMATYSDMILYKSFKSLEEKVNHYDNTDKFRFELFEEEARNRMLRRELNKQIRQQRNHIKSVIYDSNAKIDFLRSQVEDADVTSEIRSRYVEHWQTARSEQHLKTIHDKETMPMGVIEYFKERADNEQRVHAEVELLMNISINETLETVDKWMDKYDTDMENIDLKIQIKKNDYQNMLEKRINLEETIEKHDIMMKEWIEFKEEREKIRLYKETMNKSAITVQAWWRGLLVRRQLGPYKGSKVAKKKGGVPKK